MVFYAKLDLSSTTVRRYPEHEALQTPYVLAGCVSNSDVVIGFFGADSAKALKVEYSTKASHIDDFYAHMSEVVHHFRTEHQSAVVANACFALPGVQDGNLYKHPHLPWITGTVDASGQKEHGIIISKLVEAINLSRQDVLIVNDFAAVAMGIQASDSSLFIELQKGDDVAKMPKLVTGPGVGFGNNLLIWDAKLEKYKPMQLQYSFTEFGAQSALELEYLEYLKKHAFNAWGKVLGASSNASGIKLMYKFFRDRDEKHSDEDLDSDDDFDIEKIDFLEVFKKRHVSKYSAQAVDLYMTLYARAVRNEVYAQTATGGVYLTNSVVVENQDLFATPEFLQKIKDVSHQGNDTASRNYLSGYLNKIPVYVVVDPKVQLYGAAMLCPITNAE